MAFRQSHPGSLGQGSTHMNHSDQKIRTATEYFVLDFLIYFNFIYRVLMTNNGQFTVGYGLIYVMDYYVTFKII